METKETRKSELEITSHDTNKSVNSSHEQRHERSMDTTLRDFIISIIRPIFDKEISKFEETNMPTTPDLKYDSMYQYINWSYAPGTVRSIKEIENQFYKSEPEVKKVMHLYLTGHSALEIQRILLIKRITTVIKHIHIFHISTK